MIRRHDSADVEAGAHAATEQDCQAVVAAANALSLKEFDFFRLAYRRWFGSQPDPQVLERAFARYMLASRVPPWVRQLSREVIDRRRTGTLTATAFGAAAYRDRPTRPARGRLYVGMVVAIWLAFVAVLLSLRVPSPGDANEARCGGAAGLVVVSVIAETLSGRPVGCDVTER